MHITPEPEIFLSHDWPRNIYYHGDKEQLLQKKPFFRQEINRSELGSVPAEQLLHQLKPSYWFSSHLHVRFEAEVLHNQKTERNQNEISLDYSSSSSSSSSSDSPKGKSTPGIKNMRKKKAKTLHKASEVAKSTHFLALDKCLPNRKYLEIVRIELNGQNEIDDSDRGLRYDPEWLAITRAYDSYYSNTVEQIPLPLTFEATEYGQKLYIYIYKSDYKCLC